MIAHKCHPRKYGYEVVGWVLLSAEDEMRLCVSMCCFVDTEPLYVIGWDTSKTAHMIDPSHFIHLHSQITCQQWEIV